MNDEQYQQAAIRYKHCDCWITCKPCKEFQVEHNNRQDAYAEEREASRY